MDNQRRLHARAARFAGRFSGTDPLRSAKATARVRARLPNAAPVYALTVASVSDRDLPDIEARMRNYHHRPMDYPDATLVHLAQRDSLSTVFTIDHDDFQTYRFGGRKRLRILPSK